MKPINKTSICPWLQLTAPWLLLLYGSLVQEMQAQVPSLQWQRALGGTAFDVPKCVYQTKDGGFIVGGSTGSKDGDVVGNHGGGDMWVVKLSSAGVIQWQRTLGGGGQDQGTLLQQTLDGGYIIGGNTSSSNGDVKGYHGGGDIWVVKLSEKGVIQWQRSLGGSGLEEILALQEVVVNGTSNGFIVGGNTQSGNGDVTGYHVGQNSRRPPNDVWVVKLSSTGALQWQRALGSSGDETLNEMAPTADGEFLVGSRTSTNDGDVSGVHGDIDLWIIRLDAVGNIKWKRALGGSGFENVAALRPTTDGGCIVGTSSRSNDGDVSGSSTNIGIWIAKLNSSGQLTWQKKFDENIKSEYRDVRQTSDGGFVVCGMQWANTTTGGGGVLVAKLKADGILSWQKEYGGRENDEPYLMQQTSDKGYIIGGTTSSPDINGFHGQIDYWMLKLTETGSKQWERAYGGSDEDWPWIGCCGATTVGGLGYINYSSLLPYMKLQSADGGYIFAVSTESRDGDVTGLHYSARTGLRSDMWVVKLSANGTPVTTLSTQPGIESTMQVPHKINAFPNPFIRQTTIQFTAFTSGPTTIDLYGVDGARVRTVFRQTVKAGEVYTVPVAGAQLPKGVYFYQLRDSRGQQSGRLIKD